MAIPINGHNDLSVISTWLDEIRTGDYDKAPETDTERYLRKMDEAFDAHCEAQAERRGIVHDRHGNVLR